MRECQADQVLFDYLEEELPPDQAARIEAHLLQCAVCRQKLHRVQQNVGLVHATLARLDPTPGTQAGPQPDLTPLPAHHKSSIRRPAAIFAAAMFVLAIFVVLVRIGGRPPEDSNTTNAIKDAELLAVEADWPEDAQRDWDDQNLTIQVVNRKNQTVEVIRASLRSGKIKPLRLTGAAAQ